MAETHIYMGELCGHPDTRTNTSPEAQRVYLFQGKYRSFEGILRFRRDNPTMNPTPEELKELDEAFFSELLTNPVDLLSWTGPFVHWETGIDLGSPNEPSASFVMKVLLGSNPKLSNKYLSIF